MARSILIPNHKTYILCPAGNQAQETFGKMEDLAKDNIASVSGATSVFWDELIRANGTSDGFVHDKTSHHCELYNGAEVSTVNSVPKNIVGIRRLHRQLAAEEGTAILSGSDNVRFAGNRIHRCPAAIFVEFVPYNVRGHRAALFWGKKTHVKGLTFFLAAQV